MNKTHKNIQKWVYANQMKELLLNQNQLVMMKMVVNNENQQ